MKWLPSDEMWLTYLRLDAEAGELGYDLAIDASGAGQPSPVAAGFQPVPPRDPVRFDGYRAALWSAIGILVALGVAGLLERRRTDRPAI
jgi:hypothetical protein